MGRIPDSEKDRAFEIWVKHDSMQRVHRETGISRDTLYRIKKEEGWDQRRANRRREVQRRADVKAIQSEMSNLKRACELLDDAFERIKEQLKKADYTVRVREITELMRYIDDLAGGTPAGASLLDGIDPEHIKDRGELVRLLGNIAQGLEIRGAVTREELDEL